MSALFIVFGELFAHNTSDDDFLFQHLNRLVVKADTATVCIPELDFEIPPLSMRGSITTVENILLHAVEDLGKEQPIRKVR